MLIVSIEIISDGGKMKRAVLWIIVLVLMFTLASCFRIEKSGIAVYHPTDSETSICDFGFPIEFLQKYKYINGDYHYVDYSPNSFNPGSDRSLLYMVYDEETFNEASEYIMNTISVSSELLARINGYDFYIIDKKEINKFADHFMAVSFNQELNIILFVGYCYYGDGAKTYTTPEEFIVDTYKDLYDFGKGAEEL